MRAISGTSCEEAGDGEELERGVIGEKRRSIYEPRRKGAAFVQSSCRLACLFPRTNVVVCDFIYDHLQRLARLGQLPRRESLERVQVASPAAPDDGVLFLSSLPPTAHLS